MFWWCSEWRIQYAEKVPTVRWHFHNESRHYHKWSLKLFISEDLCGQVSQFYSIPIIVKHHLQVCNKQNVRTPADTIHSVKSWIIINLKLDNNTWNKLKMDSSRMSWRWKQWSWTEAGSIEDELQWWRWAAGRWLVWWAAPRPAPPHPVQSVSGTQSRSP